jgi:hypothetical protein
MRLIVMRADTVSRVAWVCFGVIITLSVWQTAQMPLHMDCNWILTVAKRMLTGQKLYGIAGVDVNPPLIFHLMQIPVVLSQSWEITYKAGFLLFIYAIASVSLTLAYALLPQYQGREKAIVFGALLYGALVLCGYQFGQREHLLLLLALPYLLLAAQRLEGKKINPLKRMVFSVFAALGFCLKPHIFLLPAVLECFIAYRARRFSKIFSVEAWGMVLVLCSYCAFIVLRYPDYVNFHARTLTQLYAGFGSIENLKHNPYLPYALIILVMLVLLLAHSRKLLRMGTPQQRNLMQITLLSSVLFYFCAIIQWRFYAYHLLPAFIFILICFAQGIVLLRFKERLYSLGMALSIGLGLFYYENIGIMEKKGGWK